MNMLYCKFYTGLMYLVILFWQRIISLVLQFCDIYVYSLSQKYCNSGCTWTNINPCIAIIAFFLGLTREDVRAYLIFLPLSNDVRLKDILLGKKGYVVVVVVSNDVIYFFFQKIIHIFLFLP